MKEVHVLMNFRINDKRWRKGSISGRICAFAVCFVMLGLLAAVPAFADDTYIVVGGTAGGLAPAGNVNSGASAVTGSNGVVIGTPAAISSAGTQQTVVANGNGDTVVVVSDGVKNTTVTVAATGNNAVNGAVIGNAIPDAAARTVAVPDSGITVTPDLVTGLRAEIFEKTNAFRAENGLHALSYNADLQTAANTRAQESAVQFNHIRPDGSEAFTVVTVDYNVTGENLIQAENGIVSAEILMETWKNSGTHRMNLLHPSYTSMAVGVYQENGMTFVSQVFIG